jgi:hypothetical protein
VDTDIISDIAGRSNGSLGPSLQSPICLLLAGELTAMVIDRLEWVKQGEKAGKVAYMYGESP